MKRLEDVETYIHQTISEPMMAIPVLKRRRRRRLMPIIAFAALLGITMLLSYPQQKTHIEKTQTDSTDAMDENEEYKNSQIETGQTPPGQCTLFVAYDLYGKPFSEGHCQMIFTENYEEAQKYLTFPKQMGNEPFTSFELSYRSEIPAEFEQKWLEKLVASKEKRLVVPIPPEQLTLGRVGVNYGTKYNLIFRKEDAYPTPNGVEIAMPDGTLLYKTDGDKSVDYINETPKFAVYLYFPSHMRTPYMIERSYRYSQTILQQNPSILR